MASMLVTRPFPQSQRLSFYDQHKGKTFLIGEDDQIVGWMDENRLNRSKQLETHGFLAHITLISSSDGLKCMFRLHHSHWDFIRQETFLMVELYFEEIQWH